MPNPSGQTRQLHLGIFLFSVGYHPGAWRLPDVDPRASHDPDFIVRIARQVEAAKFDFFFLGDALATSAEQQYVFPSQMIRLEPISMLSYIAAHTREIGLIGTINTTYADPYHVARQTASLDHLSRGRLAWNVVTGSDPRAAVNFSRDHHWDSARRYDWAEELVDTVGKLWDSWEDTALLGDKEQGLLVDPDRLHAINHSGEFFQVKGPLNVLRPLQGQIPLVNAGTSARSRAFGSAHSTVVFSGVPTLESAQAFYSEIKQSAIGHGRKAEDVSVLPGLVPYVGRTTDDAYRLYQRLSGLIATPFDAAVLERELGVPLAGLSQTDPFPVVDASTSALARYFVAQASKLNRTTQPTVRQIFEYFIARGRGHFLAIGSAEEVADTIQYWFENGAADGFNICPPHLPGGLDDFIELVLPILRARGLFREDYTGRTFRGHFGSEEPPRNRYEGAEVATRAAPQGLHETHHRLNDAFVATDGN